MKMKHSISYYYVLITCMFVCLVTLLSCSDEDVSTNPNDKLSFTENSFTFDTVFSTVGSTTGTIKVYNNNKDALIISSIYLAGGANSPFKLNVSGVSSATQSFSDVFIRAKDSLYIFVQLTVNPSNENTPVFIQDSIVFNVNGNTQYYLLQAYGQDVIILRNLSILNDTTLLNTKPYLIYGNLSVAENKTLTIEKGCVFYFHKNAGLIVHGNLNAIGTFNKPIVFRADRLDKIEDEPYDAYSGQWNGITLTSQTAIHQLDYVNIRNAVHGIDCWCGETSKPQLTILNSSIHNFDSCGILAKNVNLTLINTQLSNCGEYCLKIQGGEFTIIHSTIANFYKKINRRKISVLIRNYEDDATKIYPITNGIIKNSIIHGNNGEELFLDYKINDVPVSADFLVTISNCLINGTSSSDPHFSSILWSSDLETVFLKTNKYPFNFELTATAAAKNTADMTIANLYPIDKNKNSRIIDLQADMGAYEWVSP